MGSTTRKFRKLHARDQTDEVVRMVEYQCDDAVELDKIEEVFRRMTAELTTAEMASPEGGERGRAVVRVLVASLRIATAAAGMMGMDERGAYNSVAKTFSERLKSFHKRAAEKDRVS